MQLRPQPNPPWHPKRLPHLTSRHLRLAFSPFVERYRVLRDPALPVTPTPTYSVAGTAALLNEGLHIWDAGVGVPVTKVKDLQYNQTSTGLQPAQVDKSTIFGMVNLYWIG